MFATIQIKKTLNFEELLENSWSGAVDVLKEVQQQHREDEAMQLIMEAFSDAPDETEVNDFIWFELPDEMNLYDEEEDDEEEDDEDVAGCK